MKNKILGACLVLASTVASAQDSSFIDLGRTQVRKEFLQGVTLEAKDLQKLPFATLEEVVNVWFNGVYTEEANILYVIDGNIIADANIYAIQDIESITLVQNAAAHANGISRQQQLVVVKTKKAASTGLNVAGKAHKVDRTIYNSVADEKEHKGDGFYQQYLLSGTYAADKFKAGVSAGLLHNVFPDYDDPTLVIRTADKYDRYHVNTHAAWNPASNHEITARFNFLTQPAKVATTSTSLAPGGIDHTYDRSGRDKGINAEVGLRSRFGNGFTNKFTAAYAGMKYHLEEHYFSAVSPYRFDTDFDRETESLLITNTIRYTKTKDNWTLSPAVNLMYRNLEEKSESISVSAISLPPTVSYSVLRGEIEKFLVSPSFDVAYKKLLNLQAGTVGDLSKKKTQSLNSYVTTSINLLGLINENTSNHFTIYGSWSDAGFLYDNISPLRNFNFYPPTYFPLNGTPIPFIQPDSNVNNWQLGSSAGFFKDRLSLSYNYEHREYVGLASIIVFGGQSITVSPKANSATHQMRLSFKAVENAKTKWYTGLHATSIKNDIERYPQSPATDYFVVGDVNDEKRSWTGGWNNRISWRGFSFGADVLFHLSKKGTQFLPGGGVTDLQYNPVSLAYAFLGYHFKIQGIKESEVFISTRNMIQNKDYLMFYDTRRFYGLGLKLGL